MADQPLCRRSLFAVWRWPWRVKITFALMAAIFYPLSAVPVNYFIARAGLWKTPARTCFEIVYAPVLFTANHSEAVMNVMKWEANWMASTFGELKAGP